MEAISLNFDPKSLIAINVMIALMMFGVSLELKLEDFKRVLLKPKSPLLGLSFQFILLPALTCLLIWLLDLQPMLALGLLLVASCPGGVFSNIMTWLAKGNIALSVSMTAVSSIAAAVMTPFNFAFYSWLNPITREAVQTIAIQPLELFMLVLLVLVLPLVCGMSFARHFPLVAEPLKKWLKLVALFFMLLLIGLAFAKNTEHFVRYFEQFFFLVVLHNALAISLGFFGAKVTGLPQADQRAIALEVGIQNSALALVIIFTFFPQASEMLLIAAFWGIWHLVSGLTLAAIWSGKPAPEVERAIIETANP
ncbi:MAG: bile acid:sodium symporter family protein [Enterobacterales bacterium]|nr:bile acid:sodium symporter family protein [Enterobacterales bacterium]